ncbi:MAG TPA: hypothetical protein PK735_12280 [Flavobacteriales bacterium]|nr:hypothetical protein [Flavobacteriales bacterium]
MKAAQKDRALWLTIANTMGDDAQLTTEQARADAPCMFQQSR